VTPERGSRALGIIDLSGRRSGTAEDGLLKGANAVTTYRLHIDIQQPPETIIVAVVGELYFESCLELDDASVEIVLAHRPTLSIIDLEQLTFLDSGGIRTLVGFGSRPEAGTPA
jgi:hypothetical protein